MPENFSRSVTACRSKSAKPSPSKSATQSQVHSGEWSKKTYQSILGSEVKVRVLPVSTHIGEWSKSATQSQVDIGSQVHIESNIKVLHSPRCILGSEVKVQHSPRCTLGCKVKVQHSPRCILGSEVKVQHSPRFMLGSEVKVLPVPCSYLGVK